VDKRTLYILTLSLSLIGCAWLLWNFFEQKEFHTVPSPCLIKQTTGLPCPSCGTTTAMIALVHGEVRSSFLINPFGFFMMGAMAAFPLWILFDLLRRENSFFRFYCRLENIFQQRRWVSVPAVLLVVINWIWNISKGL
jgi:hypothetical protein